MEPGGLAVRILGPVQLLPAGGGVIELPSASQRRLLGALAIHVSTPVRGAWLCEVLGVQSGALRMSISRLRRVVGDDALHTTIGGYCLDAPVDATTACAELRSASEDPNVIASALARWVGPALEEFADESWAVGEVGRLATIRATAVEDLADALIAAGRPDDALSTLTPHVVEHPYRDRPRGLVVRALAARGRQTEALRAFQAYRDLLAEMVGTEPSPDLRAIEQRVATGWDGVEQDGTPRRALAPGVTRVRSGVPEPLASGPSSVGRRTELAALADVARRSLDGRRTVLVSGEAGIGKTMLFAAFAREVCVPSGWNVVYGQCLEQGALPFQPFIAPLRQLVDALSDAALVDHSARHGGNLMRLVPQLDQRVAVSLPAPQIESTARHQLFEAVADVIKRSAAIAPVVVVLDDLHWAKPATLQLLRHLGRDLHDSPVLLVAGLRDVAAADDHLRAALADLARADAVRIELDGLDATELGELVQRRVAATVDRDVEAVAARLWAETSGNPLFADHLLRHWVREQQLMVNEREVRPPVPNDLGVPTELRDLVWHRVTALGPDAAGVLTAAAVLGAQFNQRVVAAMTGMTDVDVAGLLDRAVAAGVLAAQPSLSGSVRFAHALVARALEADVGTQTATLLHGQAFEAMLAVPSAPLAELAPQLARHARLGGMLDHALRWAITAGDLAMADLAPDEAARWFGDALNIATALGRGDADRADVLVRLGEAETRAGHPSALDTIRRAATLAQACGADVTLIRTALASSRGSVRLSWSAEQLAIVEAAVARSATADLSTRARLHAVLAQSLERTDQTERRRTAALEALALARSSLDPGLLARVAPDLLYALCAPGSATVRSELAAEAAAVVDDMDDPHLAFSVYRAAHEAVVCAGDAGRAQRYLDRLHAIANQIGAPHMQWHVRCLDAYTATMEARFDDAETIMGDALERGTEIGDPDAFAVYAAQLFVLGTFAGRHAELLPIIQHMVDTKPDAVFRLSHAIVCCEVGQTEIASELLHEAMASELDAISQHWVGSTTLIGHAVLAIELEDVAAAAWLAPAIEPMAGEVSFNGVTSQGPVAAYAGKLASLLGRHDDAERYLLDALATAEEFGWEYHRASTLVALAENRTRAGDGLRADGERWLADAEDLCATLGVQSWGRRAARVRALVTV